MTTSATKLPVKTGVAAMDMATTMFGDGITVVSATYSGDALSAGIYSSGDTISPGVVPSDGGVILSTGLASNYTNASGQSNQSDSQSTDTAGFNNNAALNAIAGVKTYDGAQLSASFIPQGDTITMRLVFGSEEYPEWVNAGYNDVVAIWINGIKVELTIGDGDISIDNINSTQNSNLYRDNTQDQYNTEMDGVTGVLTLKSPVIPGQINTIAIAIADGGDAVYDSNLLIVADSIQTALIAHDDTSIVTLKGDSSFNLMSNDMTTGRAGVHVSHINDQVAVIGQDITLSTGEVLHLNMDGTVSLLATATSDKVTFSYTITDAKGTADTAFVTIEARPVQGTEGNDAMHVNYTDKDGRMIDGTDGMSEVIMGYGGKDKITAGQGDDDIHGGTGDDFVRAGKGSDLVYGGIGNDVVNGQSGTDTMYGGAGDDVFWIYDSGDVVVDEANGGHDKVRSDFDHVLSEQFEDLWLNQGSAATIATGNVAANKIVGNANANVISGLGANDSLFGNDGEDRIDAGAGDDNIWGGGDADIISGGDGLDKVIAGAGADIVSGGAGNDNIAGGFGADRLTGGTGTDILNGGDGADIFVFAKGDKAATIVDFQDGIDHIELSGTSFDALNLRASGDNVLMSYADGDMVTIKGMTLAHLDAGDFVFV